MAGYSAVMAEAGLADESLMVQTKAPSSVQVGCELLREIVTRRPDVDAVFCNNDDVALGALFECQRLGISVPERLGIAGFNDFEMSAAAEPPITSRSEEHTTELQSLMRISYAVFCLKKKKTKNTIYKTTNK